MTLEVTQDCNLARAKKPVQLIAAAGGVAIS